MTFTIRLPDLTAAETREVLVGLIREEARIGELANHAERVILRAIHEQEKTIMATLQNVVDILTQEVADEQKLATDVETLIGTVSSLQQTIADLQASLGQLTPEQQALVDQAAAQAQSIDDSLNALDAQVAPATPPPA